MNKIQFLSTAISSQQKDKPPEINSEEFDTAMCYKHRMLKLFFIIPLLLLEIILCYGQKLEIVAQHLSELNNPFVYKNSLYFSNPLSEYNSTNGFTIVALPEGGKVMSNSSHLLNKELYYWLSFTNNNETRYKLAKLDGTTMSLIPNSTCLSIQSPLLFNEKIYLNYFNSSNKKQISIYNQFATTLVANPDSGIGAVDFPFIYNNVVYTKYQDINKKNFLGKCDNLTLSLIANPDSGYGLFGSQHLIFNDTLLLYYKNIQSKIQLAKYDGNTLSLIANPDSGSIDTTNFQTVTYNHQLFFLYRDNSNKVQVAKYDGKRLSLLSNPESLNIYTSDFRRVTCKDSLLFKFKSATNQVQLVKCDGKSISSIIPTDPSLVFSDIAFIYKNVPYLKFSNNTRNQCFIAKYDGLNLTLFTNSSNGINKIDSLFEFKDNLYLLVNDQIARLANSTYSIIPYPSCGGNCITKYSNAIPPLFINNRLFLSLSITVQLLPNPRYLVNYVEFDGSGFTLIKSVDVTFGRDAFKKIAEYKNNLYYTLRYTGGMVDVGESGIFRTDGNRKTIISFDALPDVPAYRFSKHYFESSIIYRDTLYIIQYCYQSNETWNTFPRYPSSPTNVRLWRLNEDEPKAPTIQASGIKISNITHDSFDISWKNGNGLARLVYVSPKGYSPDVSDYTTYSANRNLRASGFVYNGQDSTVHMSVSFILHNDFDVYVYEYNGSPTCEKYNTSTALDNPNSFSFPKYNQTISYNPLPQKSFGDNDFSPGATASSGLPIIYNSSDSTVAIIVDDLVHLVGSGSVNITASQPGTIFYDSAQSILQTLIVDNRNNLYISFHPLPTKRVGDPDFDPRAAAIDGSKITYSSSDTTVAQILNGLLHIVGIGSTIITAYASDSMAISVFTVMAPILTFPPIPQKTIGISDFSPGALASDNSNFEYSSSDTSIAVIINNQVHIKDGGSCIITAKNWSGSISQQLNVSCPNISFPNIPTKRVGDLDFDPGPTTNPYNLKIKYSSNDTTIAVIVNGLVHIRKAGSTTIMANYCNQGSGRSLIVSPNITFPVLPVKRFGDIDFSPGATAYDGAKIEYSSSDTSVAIIVVGLIHIKAAGTATIIAVESGNADSITKTPVEQVLIVNKLNQDIFILSFPIKKFGDAPFRIESGSTYGLMPNFSSSNLNVATINGNMVTIVGAGSAEITASLEGNRNYNAAKSTALTLIVNKADQFITFSDFPPKKIGDADFDPGAFASNGSKIEYASSDTTVATIVNGLIHITGLGSTQITASQAGNDVYSAACDITQTLIVTTTTGEVLEKTSKIKIYPNPTSDFIQLDLPQTIQKITIYNSQGKIVYMFNLKKYKSKLDLRNLPTGIYFLKVQIDVDIYVQKVVKR